MPKCKFCGGAVITTPVYHAACLEKRIDELAEQICDSYCKYPLMLDEWELEEQCAQCGMMDALGKVV